MCGIVTFTIDGVSPADVQRSLDADGILLGVSDYRYAELDLQARGVPAVLRASPHCYNDSDEIALLAEKIADLSRRR